MRELHQVSPARSMKTGPAAESAWPRSLHVGNIANVAYGNAKTLERHGAPVRLICHDLTHLMSQPEWDDLDLDPKDFPDEMRFDINSADFGDYRRPSWFTSEKLWVSPDDSRSLPVRLAARHLPARAKRALKPLYYRARLLRDRLSSQLRPAAPVDGAARIEALVSAAQQLGAPWPIDPRELAAYETHGRWLAAHMKEADVVFSYALAPIYSLFCPDKPHVSVDVGTMRDIPFHLTPAGRLLWLANRRVDHVLLTNPDTRQIAEAAGIDNYSFCPHPVDEAICHPGEESALRRHLQEQYGGGALVFAPARQNWELKGNDKMFRGFAQALKSGTKATLLVAGWGQEIARSKALCRQLGIDERVVWLAPMPEPLLARYYRAVDLVLDQFQLGVFGLITAKAMACGAVVLTSYERRHNDWCFPVPAPVVRCSSKDDVAEAVSRLAVDPEARRRIGAASQAWVAAHHSSQIVADRLSRVMESARSHFEARRQGGS